MGIGRSRNEVMMSLLWLLVVVIVGAENECPEESRCSGSGPAVRFPFRLQGIQQPPHCGYPAGFDVYCSESKLLVLQLPVSVKLIVSEIDYKSKAIQVYDPEGCFPKQLRNLDLSASPFHLERRDDAYYFNYTLFNCSLPSYNMEPESPWPEHFNVPCLGVPGYTVKACHSTSEVEYLPDLLSCTKIYNSNSAVPEAVFNGGKNNNISIHLKWSIPKCKICEAGGKSCGLMNGTLECFDAPKQPSGIPRRIMITGVGIGSFLLVVAAIALYLSHSSYKENQVKIEKFLEDYKALKPTRYSYADLKRITNQFKDKVGEGGYGTVFRGKLSNETLVAVKVLNNSTGNGEEFINEMGIMGKIHHVNVARLVGFCADGFRRAIVYEFLGNGSLDKFICPEEDHQKNYSFGWDTLQSIALGIAKGLEYLHQGCEQRILHFDIKPHNILLDHNFNPKIIDFGLAKLCAKERSVVTMTAARGTMGYIAPEVFSRNFGNVSYKSDVYSFGMLLLEMVGSRKKKNAEIITTTSLAAENQVYFPEWIYSRLGRGEEIGIQIEVEGDEKIGRKLAIVGLWCIQWHPVDRPSINVVVQMLEGEGDALTLPPNPFAPMNSTTKMHRTFNSNLVVISESD